MSFTIPTIFKAIDQMTAPIRRMQGAVKGFGNSASTAMAKVDRRVNKLMPSFGNLGKEMLKFGAATAVFAGVVSAINVAKDFEQANADLAAAMGKTRKEISPLTEDAKRLGSITSKSASEVTALQEAYARLGFEQEQILAMTGDTISGSVAMNGGLKETAELTGAVIKTFKAFNPGDAGEVLDKMTLSTQKSALSFEKLQTALPNVGGAAEAAGIDFGTTLALLGKLSDAGIDASSSSTALRNIFLDSEKKGLSYNQILDKIAKSADKLTPAMDEFGKRGAVSAVVLADKLKETSDLAGQLNKDFEGVASKAEQERLATLSGSIELLKSAWEGFIISLNDGTRASRVFQGVIKFLADNMNWIATVGMSVVGMFALWKTAMLTAKVIGVGYNIFLGLQAALLGGSAMALKGNALALGIYKGAILAAKIAQAAFNFVLSINPIVFVVTALLGLIALIVIFRKEIWEGIKNIEAWSSALMFISLPIGLIINGFIILKRHWDSIVSSFSSGGILGGLKAIGLAIVDFLLMPIQQLLSLIDSIPGIEFAGNLNNDIDAFKKSIGIDVEDTETVNPKVQQQEAISQTISESKDSKELTVNIKDETGRAAVEGDGQSTPIALKSTMSI